MRECRIDRIRLCKTGSDERNSSALFKTNAGSSTNSTLSSMPEILPDLEPRCESLNREARNWERVTEVRKYIHCLTSSPTTSRTPSAALYRPVPEGAAKPPLTG